MTPPPHKNRRTLVEPIGSEFVAVQAECAWLVVRLGTPDVACGVLVEDVFGERLEMGSLDVRQSDDMVVTPGTKIRRSVA